jgi:hypothetical protein
MGVRYTPIDGESVSAIWKTVLDDMRADGVDFNVNEGHRTFARQWEFYNLYLAGRGNLAAYPSSTAPHIRTGRFDHAIDFSNDVAVFSWLSRHGLEPARTVAGESWHIECPAARLKAYHDAHKPKPSPLRFVGKVRRKASEVLLRRRRLRKAEARSGKGPRWHRLNAAVKRSYRQVATYAKRAKPSRVKRILNRVLKDRDGRL